MSRSSGTVTIHEGAQFPLFMPWSEARYFVEFYNTADAKALPCWVPISTAV